MTQTYHDRLAELFPLQLMATADEQLLQQAAFISRGIAVSNPRLSTCSRFEVAPSSYGLTQEQADAMIGLNRVIADVARIVMDSAKVSVTMGQTDDDAIDNMMNAGAAAIQNQLGIDTGDFAAMYFSGEDIAKEMKQIYRLLSDGTQSQQSREQTAMRLSEIFLDYARSEIAFAQREAGGDPDASGQERKQFFVLQTVEDDLPTLHGPFLTWDAMLEAAKALFAESPEDVLMHIEVPRGVEPRIDCFTDAMLESTEPFIKAMAEGLRQGEPVITRLKVQGVRYFTGQYEGEEIIINDDIADMLAQELGETIYVVEELTQEVAMMGRHAMQRFPESDWIEAAKAGKTLQGLHTWRLEQLDTLTKLASCK